MTGIQLLFLGVIGEYVGRIYEQVKLRPMYVVEKVVDAANAKIDSASPTCQTESKIGCVESSEKGVSSVFPAIETDPNSTSLSLIHI